MGRKRSQDENDTINLYFLDDIGRISGFCTKYKKDVEIAKEYELLKDAGQLDEFKKKYLKIRLPCFFDNEPKIIYPAYYKILSDCEFYESIVSKGTSFHKEVENRLGRKAVWYERKKKNEELSSYLSKNIGRRYEKDEREELVRIIDYRKDGHLSLDLKMFTRHFLFWIHGRKVSNNIIRDGCKIRCSRPLWCYSFVRLVFQYPLILCEMQYKQLNHKPNAFPVRSYHAKQFALVVQVLIYHRS